MKRSTIALAAVIAVTCAFAQAGNAAPLSPGAQGASISRGAMEHHAAGMSRTTGRRGFVPSGDPNGPAALSGSGPSTFGGNSPAIIR